MFSFKPITEHLVTILDQSNSNQQHIRNQLAKYKSRWNESLATNITIVTSFDEAPIGAVVIAPGYVKPSLHHTVHQVTSINQMTHYDLRAAVIKPKVNLVPIEETLSILNSANSPVALDFEAGTALTKVEQQALEPTTHVDKLLKNTVALSHPSLTVITHLSFAFTETESYVVILDTEDKRNQIFNWIVSTKLKQIWHNANFDLYHVYYHTRKLPVDFEDSQLMWSTILNHTNEQERLTGLKHLAKKIYKNWAIGSEKFGLEHMYDQDVIEYAGIDTQATMYLYNEALAHPDFQLTTKPVPLANIFPIKFPKEFNPGRRFFYESVVKPTLRAVIEMRAVGLPLDMEKVYTLRDDLDKVREEAQQELNSNQLIEDFQKEVFTKAKANFIQTTKEKQRQLDYYLKPFNIDNMDHRSYLMNYLSFQYDLQYKPDGLLPDGTLKWTAKDVKLCYDACQLPILRDILDKNIPEDSVIARAAMRMYATTKANLYNKQYVDQLADLSGFTIPEFNPGSNPQVSQLFSKHNLPPVAFSKETGEPSYGREALEIYEQQIPPGPMLDIIKSLLKISSVKTTRTNFVENFLSYHINERVYPSYKLWGTLSFRPSGGGDKKGVKSGFINPLNQPATGSPQAKLVKKCIAAPAGKILIAADLSSLEDRVIANISNSKAKKDLILDGYDGHLYHAAMYFRPQFIELLDAPKDIPHTDLVRMAMASDLKEIKELRQTSKGVTFGASYGAFPKKISESIGCSLEEGERIFNAYHNDLYPEITDYRENYILKSAKQHGEIHMLLGASLRTDNADKDIRTLNNASIQSFSAITLVAGAQFTELTKSEHKQDEAKIFNMVYDAIYIEADLNPYTIKWVNDNLIPLMTQQYLENEDIPNAAECDIGFNLAETITLPNNASIEEIEEALTKLKEKHV